MTKKESLNLGLINTNAINNVQTFPPHFPSLGKIFSIKKARCGAIFPANGLLDSSSSLLICWRSIKVSPYTFVNLFPSKRGVPAYLSFLNIFLAVYS
jgi:hypothetical protein